MEENRDEWAIIRGALQEFTGELFKTGCRYNAGFSSQISIDTRKISMEIRYESICQIQIYFEGFSAGSYAIRNGRGDMIRSGGLPPSAFSSTASLSSALVGILNQLIQRADAVNPIP